MTTSTATSAKSTKVQLLNHLIPDAGKKVEKKEEVIYGEAVDKKVDC